MNENQREEMLWRISLVVAIFVAIFWGGWYLIAEEIPTVSQIKWYEDTSIQLPFVVSRLWDIVFAPIWAIILFLLFTNSRVREENQDKSEDYGSGPLLFGGLIFGMIVGLGFGLGPALLVGLISGLIAGALFDLPCALIIGLGTALVFGLGPALIVGLGVGLIFALVFGLGIELGIVLVVIISLFCEKARDWVAGN